MIPQSIKYDDTLFLQTSKTRAKANRLNWRCEMLLTRNAEAIRNKRVLDLASHDGRFSYACLKLGAKHVTGIEGRSHLVESSKKNLEVLGFSSENSRFLQGDIFEYLPKFNSGDFDTILCFGFFYHTIRQIELLSEIKRLHPQYFILDTDVYRSNFIIKSLRLIRKFRFKHIIPGNLKALMTSLEGYELVFKLENPYKEGSTIEPSGWRAFPTKPLVEMLLRLYGFDFCSINWHGLNIPSWSDLEDYKKGKRISCIAQLQ